MEKELELVGKHFTDTIFYQIELTSRYVKMLGAQLFNKLDISLSIDEFSTLDTLSYHDSLCQRDLAKLILRDRANMGRILDSLENKGFVKRNLSIKDNRPVKIVKITSLGREFYEDTFKKLAIHHKNVEEKIKNTDLAKLGKLLKDLREVLKDSVEIGI